MATIFKKAYIQIFNDLTNDTRAGFYQYTEPIVGGKASYHSLVTLTNRTREDITNRISDEKPESATRYLKDAITWATGVRNHSKINLLCLNYIMYQYLLASKL